MIKSSAGADTYHKSGKAKSKTDIAAPGLFFSHFKGKCG